jgi:23S rRNA pseudouridine1911/1915/1917 synthase
MNPASLEILYEDNHLLAINKPAPLATMGAAPGEPSLAALAKEYLKSKYAKPGEVYLGVVSRLDAMVTGVTLFARTSKAAARLSEQFRTREVEKTYWAVVENADAPATGECHDWLRKDDAAHRMVIARAGAPGAQEAKLTFRRLQTVTGGALLEVTLETGRKHQIRVQLASRGWAVIGDRKYDARTHFDPGIALHARQLTIDHPTRHEPITIVAPLPASWSRWRLPSPPNTENRTPKTEN